MNKAVHQQNLDAVLGKALDQKPLTKEEVVFLLGLGREEDLQLLYGAARSLRYKYFRNKVFLYGFVYFSTWCANECAFCSYRNPNHLVRRYRKTTEEILEVVCSLKESGVHLIDLTMGEDPFYHRRQDGFDSLVDLVRRLRGEINLPVMVSPGVLSPAELKKFSEAGADWYACYQETYNQDLFRRLRIKQSFSRRLFSKYLAQKAGLLVEEGLLLGVGETVEDIACSMDYMRQLGARQVRVMSFVPQEGSPLENVPAPSRVMEFKAIAVLRLLFPDRLIPASLDVDGIEGLEARLGAGANVVTSLIPPQSGLAGVARHKRDIDEGCRTVRGVLPVLEKTGMEAAAPYEYADWLMGQRNILSARAAGISGWR